MLDYLEDYYLDNHINNLCDKRLKLKKKEKIIIYVKTATNSRLLKLWDNGNRLNSDKLDPSYIEGPYEKK